jgi:predicted kinase
MHLPNHINPDHFLDRHEGRVVSPELGTAAREQAYAELARQLAAVGTQGRLYLVCGLQGAGKSTWVRRHAPTLGEHAVFFDAALPSLRHRSRALALAAATRTPVVAVWVNVPFDVALRRNAARPPHERVPEPIIQHVLEQLVPPSLDEGFVDVIEVNESGANEA